jgi:putative ABC transport system permease protein
MGEESLKASKNVGVGITNTMMMIVYERRYEIGVLKAQGLRNSKILKLFVLEGGIMGVIGSTLGITIGGTIAYYFSKRGIDLGGVLKNLGDNINVKSVIYMDFSMEILLYPLLAGIIISIITTLIAVIPELKLEAVKNLRGE